MEYIGMILLSFLAFSLSGQNLVDSEDIRKTLEFQYENQIKALRQKVEALERETQSLRSQTEACLANNKSLQKNLIDSKNQIQELKRTEKEAAQAELEAVLSPKTANEWYQSAQTQVGLNELDRAILSFEKIVKDFPQSDLADNSIFWMAKIYLSRKEAGLARAELLRLLELYPDGDRAFMAKQELVKLDKQDLAVQKDPHFTDNKK